MKVKVNPPPPSPALTAACNTLQVTSGCESWWVGFQERDGRKRKFMKPSDRQPSKLSTPCVQADGCEDAPGDQSGLPVPDKAVQGGQDGAEVHHAPPQGQAPQQHRWQEHTAGGPPKASDDVATSLALALLAL